MENSMSDQPPFPGDQEAAESYRGRTLRVRRVSLNEDLPDDLKGVKPVSAFALHPAHDVLGIDESGKLVADGTLVFVVTRGGKK
jgi:hypothetical protein